MTVVLKRGDGCDVLCFAKWVAVADPVVLYTRLGELHFTGSAINTATNAADRNGYLYTFEHDPAIQARLKARLDATGQYKPEGNVSSQKHRPS